MKTARAVTRLALQVQKRTCLGVWDHASIPVELQEPGPFPLDETMPKFPLGIHKRKREDGRPYIIDKDFEEWGTLFKAWLQEKKGTIVDADQTLISMKPYHNHEVHQKWLTEVFSKMSEEEKTLLGHTVDTERAKPHHEVYGYSYYEMKQPAVSANRPPPSKERDGLSNGTFILKRDSKNRLKFACDGQNLVTENEAEPARNYLRELEDALEKEAAEKSGKKEAEASA